MSFRYVLTVTLTVLSLGSGPAARAELGFSGHELHGEGQTTYGYLGSAVAISGETAIVGGWGEAQVFVHVEGNWVVQARLTGDGGRDAFFGSSVALSGDTAVVGAYREGHEAEGAVYVFVRRGETWTRQARLTSGVPGALDGFGGSVALSGDTLLVGVPDGNGAVTDSGTVEVFARRNGSWRLTTRLLAPGGLAKDDFGSSVALSAGRALIGDRRRTIQGISGAGAAYVFAQAGTGWHLEARLTASDAAALDRFGQAVDLDGDTAIVGAWLADPAGVDSGAAYVFTRIGSTWRQQAKLTAPDAAADDRFGFSVAISGDRAAAGAPLEDVRGDASGSVYLFQRQGSTWSLLSKVFADDTLAHDRFGQSLDLQGDTLLAGAFGASDQTYDSGSAYLFVGPLLRLAVTPAQQTAPPGSVVPITLFVRNLGPFVLNDVTVNLPSMPACDLFGETLAPGQRKSFVCPVAVGTESLTLEILARGTAPGLWPPATTAATVRVNVDDGKVRASDQGAASRRIPCAV